VSQKDPKPVSVWSLTYAQVLPVVSLILPLVTLALVAGLHWHSVWNDAHADIAAHGSVRS
jgi:hypothetical protein